MSTKSLPSLSTAEQAHCTAFDDYLRQQRPSWPFVEFMHAALYAPDYGYYRCGTQKFGVMGDFITAPEWSPLFSRCLAVQVAEVLAHLGEADVWEIGAGSGTMAAEVLLALESLQQLPCHYYILELSAELQARQAQTLHEKAPHLLPRVVWWSTLPAAHSFRGVILANEVLDAIPVHRFYVDSQRQIQSCQVVWQDHGWAWALQPADDALRRAVQHLQQQHDLPLDYLSEVGLWGQAWLREISQRLQQGLMLLIDYGYAGAEYYHPQRSRGTLMCHYRHHAHSDPLINLGVQDITAYVDFTALAEVAVAEGLQVAYTTQADFLLATGLLQQLAASSPDSPHTHLPLAQQVKTLILPDEMGERFKVMGLSRGLEAQSWSGFVRDRRAWL